MKRRWTMLGLLTGCSMDLGDINMSGDIGVTAGGFQDITLARELIAQGGIPDQEHYTAEGLFSEHDLPLDGADCDAVLCPRAAASVYAPADGGDAGMLVQLGFGTGITTDTFSRPDLDLAAIVDASGSMSGELASVKEALLTMVDQLDADDHMSLVSYGSTAELLQGRTKMDASGRAQMAQKIRKLETNGSTDMESGMQLGYDQLSAPGDRSRRVMVFSDAQPNTGVTEQSTFLKLVRAQSEDGVGTTLFGVGWDMGSELADALSKVEGGSYHFLTDDERERLFVEEFDFMVSPVAYDLSVTVSPSADGELDEVYGAPIDGREIALGASTLFLSSRSGGMGATLALLPEPEADGLALGTMHVRYRPINSDDYKEHTLDVRWEGGRYIEEADDLGVYKMAGLIDEYRSLLAASRFCDGELSQGEALDAIDAGVARLAEQAAAIADVGLTAEVALLEALRVNVEAGQDSCVPADTYVY